MPSVDEISDFLAEISNKLVKLEESALETGLETKISSAEIRIIDKIAPKGSAKMGNISKSLGISLATLTVACDKLESKGLIVRKRDDGDRRTVTLFLTEKGLVAYEFHKKFRARLAQNMLDGLSDEQRQSLDMVLKNINKLY